MVWSFIAVLGVTLPSECVSLSWPGFEDNHYARGRRGGGNVGIGFIDFQGLWEGRKTARSFSGLSINRHFHSLPRSPRTVRRRPSPLHVSIFLDMTTQVASCQVETGSKSQRARLTRIGQSQDGSPGTI